MSDYLPIALHRRSAYCGLSQCRRCTPNLANFMPNNPECSHVGEYTDVRRRRKTVYDAFIDHIEYVCRLSGWNHYEIIQGIFPDDRVKDYILSQVEEYKLLDAQESGIVTTQT